MASLKITKTNSYCRVRVWVQKKRTEITIKLNTTKKLDIQRRKKEIEKVEHLIKDGTLQRYQFAEYFPWLNDKGSSNIIVKTLEDIVDEYLTYRAIEKRSDTLRRDKISLNQLMKYIGAGLLNRF